MGGEYGEERKKERENRIKKKGICEIATRDTGRTEYGKRETASLVGNRAKRSMAKPRPCGGATDFL